MPNEAQENEVLMMDPVAREGMVSETHKSGSESGPVGGGKGQNAGSFSVYRSKSNGLSGGICEEVHTMYEADDDEASNVVDENGGKTLREHDYIGLSEMSSSSSSFQSVQQQQHSSSRRRECDKGVGEELNLNLGATELRLGPLPDLESGRGAKEGGERGSSLEKNGSAAEIGAYGRPDKGQALSLKMEGTTGSTTDQQQQTHVVSDRGLAAAASADYRVAPRDQGFSMYSNVVHATASEKKLEESSCIEDNAKNASCRSFPNTDASWHGEQQRTREQASSDESLNLGIGLVPNRLGNTSNIDVAADKKKFFHRSEGAAMEEDKQSQSDQQEISPQQQQSSNEVPFSNPRTTWPERNQCSSGMIQEDASPVSDKSMDKNLMAGRGGYHHQQQPNNLDRPKQELSMQENGVPKLQGAQTTGSKSATNPATTSAHAPPMHPSVQASSSSLQQQQPEKRYPSQEQPRYHQENILGELDRHGIVQEFNAHKLKMRQAAKNGQFWLGKPENHLHQSSSSSPQELESRAMNGPHTAGSRGGGMFPPSKTGVGGAKRGFSEAIGSSISESRNGPYPDGWNVFVEGGSSWEGSVGGGSARMNCGGTEMSQQPPKHQLATPPPSAMYPCNNPKPSPPSWQQQSLEQSGVYFGPFRSQWPARGSGSSGPPSNGADASAVSVNAELNPKAWETTRSKNLQVTGQSFEMSKHPSPDTRSSPAKEATPTSTPPRQNQVVGWPPVRNFRKNQQPLRPASQDRQPRSTPIPQTTTTTTTTTVATPPKTPASSGTVSQTNSLLVKVYMDGLPIGRKVDLVVNNSYDKLKSALEDLFQQLIGQPGSIQSSSIGGESGVSSSFNRKLNFLHSSEYVLTYEDCESDLMLVGDVPWNMFTGIVRRLRIMKGVDIAQQSGDNTTMDSQVEVD